MAAARARALAPPPLLLPLTVFPAFSHPPPSLARRSLNWIGLARHGASSQNYTRTQGIDIDRRYTGAIAYPKTIDWRIVLPVYGTSNAMEIQFNWQREHRTCNDAFPFGLASSLPLFLLFDPLRKCFFDIHLDTRQRGTSFFHVSTYRHNRSRSPGIVTVDQMNCHLERFHDWTSVRARARKSWRRMDRRREQYRAVEQGIGECFLPC